jgi:hypothetical protein
VVDEIVDVLFGIWELSYSILLLMYLRLIKTDYTGITYYCITIRLGLGIGKLIQVQQALVLAGRVALTFK